MDFLLGNDNNATEGFGLLREMEEWNDDDIKTEEDWDGLQDEVHANLSEDVGGETIAQPMGQYEAEFPPLENKEAGKKGKSGPIQVLRESTNNTGDT